MEKKNYKPFGFERQCDPLSYEALRMACIEFCGSNFELKNRSIGIEEFSLVMQGFRAGASYGAKAVIDDLKILQKGDSF